MKRRFPVLAAIWILAASAPAATLFDFDDSTSANSGQGDGKDIDGWTAIVGGWASHPSGAGGGSVSGGRFAYDPASTASNPSDDVHPGLLLISPAFTLDSSSDDLTFQLSGGRGHGGSSWGIDAPVSRAAVLGEISGNSGLTSTSGEQGVALRRVSTGEYVLTREKSAAANAWETLSFSRTELNNLISTYGAGELYTLEYFDSRNGSWGHTEIDTVSVPSAAMAAKVENGGFGKALVSHGWNAFYADTAPIGEWYVPAFADRLERVSGDYNEDMISHTGTNPAGQGTYSYIAVEPSTLSLTYELHFDYFNTEGEATSNKISWGIWGYTGTVDHDNFQNGNFGTEVQTQNPDNLIAGGSFTPGDTDWTGFISGEFVLPGNLSRIVIGIGDAGVYPASGDDTGFDNITLVATSVIPEPGSGLLLGLSGLLLVLRRKR